MIFQFFFFSFHVSLHFFSWGVGYRAVLCSLRVSPFPPLLWSPEIFRLFWWSGGGEFQEMRFFSFFEEKDNERERERFMVDGGSRVQFLNKEMKSPFLRFFFNARQAAAASAIAANS